MRQQRQYRDRRTRPSVSRVGVDDPATPVRSGTRDVCCGPDTAASTPTDSVRANATER